MKKLVMSILTILTCGAAYALPVGNPSEASLFLNGLCWESTGCCDPCDPCFSWCDAWSFRVGFYGDYVFDRHLAVDLDGEFDGDDTGSILQDSEIHTNAGYLVLNFCDRVDLFATLGATSFQTRQNITVFGAAVVLPATETELQWQTDFSWSIGARATLWECDCFALGIEGQYFSSRPDLDYFVNYTSGEKIYFSDVDSHYREWQVGLGVSYRIATSCPTLALVPYAAVKYSRAYWDIDAVSFSTFVGTGTTPVATSITLPDFETDKHWGWALGTTFTMCDLIGITVEGRWGDEKALYVNGQIRF